MPFTSVTRHQIEKVFKLNLDPLNSQSDILRLPDISTFPSLPLTEEFIRSLKFAVKNYGFKTEASRSLVVAEFLKNALIQTNNEHLQVVPQSRHNCECGGIEFAGVADYAISNDDSSSQLIVVAVKARLDEISAQLQLLAQAGSLLRQRGVHHRASPVFAVLANGQFFRFYAIDDRDSTVYSSRAILLDYRANPDFHSYQDLIDVVTWFRWFVNVMTSISRRSSPCALSAIDIRSNLAVFRRNFRLGWSMLCIDWIFCLM